MGVDSRIGYYEYGPTHCWGHQQRNWAMQRAKGTHLMFLDDDDDDLLPRSLVAVRQIAAENPNSFIIFRIHHRGSILWTDRDPRMGNVSTQMFVVPNMQSNLGNWGARYEG